MCMQKSLETDKNHGFLLIQGFFFGYICRFEIRHLKY
jgi:hypothetical protein